MVLQKAKRTWPYRRDEPPTPARASAAVTCTSSRSRFSIAAIASNRCCRTGSARTAATTRGGKWSLKKRRSKPCGSRWTRWAAITHRSQSSPGPCRLLPPTPSCVSFSSATRPVSSRCSAPPTIATGWRSSTAARPSAWKKVRSSACARSPTTPSAAAGSCWPSARSKASSAPATPAPWWPAACSSNASSRTSTGPASPPSCPPSAGPAS